MITERDEINIRRTAEKRARAEGRAEGHAMGRAEGKLEVAKKMIENGMSIDDVVKFTGMSEEEIVLAVK